MRRFDETLVHDVVQLDKQGMKWRAIARALKISRNSVRQIVTSHGRSREQPHTAFRPRRSIARASKLRSLPPADRGSAQDLPGYHHAARLRDPARRERIQRRRQHCESIDAQDPYESAAEAEPGDSAKRAWRHGRVRLVAVSGGLHARAVHDAASFWLHAALVDAQVLRHVRGQRPLPAVGWPRAGFRALPGRSAPVQVR